MRIKRNRNQFAQKLYGPDEELSGTFLLETDDEKERAIECIRYSNEQNIFDCSLDYITLYAADQENHLEFLSERDRLFNFAIVDKERTEELGRISFPSDKDELSMHIILKKGKAIAVQIHWNHMNCQLTVKFLKEMNFEDPIKSLTPAY